MLATGGAPIARYRSAREVPPRTARCVYSAAAVMMSFRANIVHVGITTLQGVVRDIIRGGPRRPPPAPERDDDHCPYCAMRPHVLLAMHAYVDAAGASGPAVRDIHLSIAQEELAAALDAGLTAEVARSERGTEVLDKLRELLATTATDLSERARMLWALSQALAALAERRNLPTQEAPA